MARSTPSEPIVTEPAGTAAPEPLVRFLAARDAFGRPVEFHSGIPARDLTARDLARLTRDQLELVRLSPLYEGDVPAPDEPGA